MSVIEQIEMEKTLSLDKAVVGEISKHVRGCANCKTINNNPEHKYCPFCGCNLKVYNGVIK